MFLSIPLSLLNFNISSSIFLTDEISALCLSSFPFSSLKEFTLITGILVVSSPIPTIVALDFNVQAPAEFCLTSFNSPRPFPGTTARILSLDTYLSGFSTGAGSTAIA